MGNCQAAEAATVVIQHPGNKVERIYWSVSANEVMTLNPGHYVALVVTSPTAKSENGTPLKQLKLLRPDDTLIIGQVYRLISFEDVLKEFAAKKCVKLGKLLKQSGGLSLEKKKCSRDPNPNSANCPSIKMEHEVCRVGSGSSSSRNRGVGRHHGGGGWGAVETSLTEHCRGWNLNAFNKPIPSHHTSPIPNPPTNKYKNSPSLLSFSYFLFLFFSDTCICIFRP
ncbi:hypothetical protein F0562_013052 [Nyssa sinensis]|uniref:DUF4228 domain-containing protein n=1 Tax=Nyssa sinensis TaxID=561372 RepID=A0A5J4ZZQ6_9ASTE|nr:hypothetical protein F0562_013052 [Nyssa sinensis]